MALTKADFAERLFNELAIDKRKAKAMVDLFFEDNWNMHYTSQRCNPI